MKDITTYTFVAIFYTDGQYDYTTILHVPASGFGLAELQAQREATRRATGNQRVIVDTAQTEVIK